MTKKSVLKSREITFSVGKLRRLIAHARASKTQIPMKEGEDGPKGPGVILVTGMTVFLASNGQDEGGEGEERVVYAEGMHPDEWNNSSDMAKKSAELVGTNEDAVFLNLAHVELLLGAARDWDFFCVTVFHDGFAMKKVLMMPAVVQEAPSWEMMA